MNTHISEHKKKISRFSFVCEIDSKIGKYEKKGKINLNITYYSTKKHLTHNYYVQFPRPMIETKMLKILDTNPKLVKSIGRYLLLNPLTE